MNREEHRSCGSKCRFRTEDEALKFGKKRGLRVYDCGFCGGYHLTSRPKVFATILPFYRTDEKSRLALRIERAQKALRELDRKGVSGPLRDAAETHLRDLEAQVFVRVSVAA